MFFIPIKSFLSLQPYINFYNITKNVRIFVKSTLCNPLERFAQFSIVIYFSHVWLWWCVLGLWRLLSLSFLCDVFEPLSGRCSACPDVLLYLRRIPISQSTVYYWIVTEKPQRLWIIFPNNTSNKLIRYHNFKEMSYCCEQVKYHLFYEKTHSNC